MTAFELTDPLTGLANKVALDSYFESQIHATVRPGVIALFIDVDHFKEINDTLGHPVGDSVIRDVATILQQCTQPYANAVAYRYAGDEFVIILPGYSRAEAVALTTVVAQLVARVSITGLARKLTLSIGAAESPPTTSQRS